MFLSRKFYEQEKNAKWNEQERIKAPVRDSEILITLEDKKKVNGFMPKGNEVHLCHSKGLNKPLY